MYTFLKIAFIGMLASHTLSYAACPTVVVTIAPIHSLVSGVMAGVGAQPSLLMTGTDSPHTHALKPSELQQLESAQVIIWVGPAYETHLRKSMDRLKERSKVITLMDTEGVHLYPNRTGGLWGEHSHDHHTSNDPTPHNHGDHSHDPLSTDGHIWLDPNNCKALVTKIAQELATLDPQHATHYHANAEKVIARLENLDQQLQKELQSVKGKPYLIFHDGMQYFDRHYETTAIGSVTSDPEIPAGGQHILSLRKLLKEGAVVCVFSEPQFDPKSVQTLIQNTDVKVGTLDYLGLDYYLCVDKTEENQYFWMMQRLVASLKAGLGKEEVF